VAVAPLLRGHVIERAHHLSAARQTLGVGRVGLGEQRQPGLFMVVKNKGPREG